MKFETWGLRRAVVGVMLPNAPFRYDKKKECEKVGFPGLV